MTTRNQRDLDDLLGDDSGQLGALYGRLSKAQPPRRLDRQILAEASRAVHGRPRGAHWLLGFGTAAGVLLAAGIAWRVNTDLIRQREGAALSTPSVAPAAAPAPEVIPIQAHAAPANRAAGSAQITRKGFDSAAADVVVTGSRIEAAPAAQPIEEKATQASAKLGRSEALSKPSAAVRMQAAEPAAISEPEASAAPPPAAPPAPASASTPTANADGAARRADAPQKSEFEGRTAAGASAPAQALVAEQTDAAAIGAVRDQAKAALPAADATTQSAIAQIRALLAEGRRVAAVSALRELRRQHPDLVIPDDLRALER